MGNINACLHQHDCTKSCGTEFWASFLNLFHQVQCALDIHVAHSAIQSKLLASCGSATTALHVNKTALCVNAKFVTVNTHIQEKVKIGSSACFLSHIW